MAALTTRLRWLIAGGAVLAAAAIVVLAIVVLGARPVPEAMTYVPGDSTVVAELRPDFPGDQLSKFGNLLAHFPGYKDQSILAQKIDETLRKLTTSATNGTVDYATQVKPWIAGPLYAGAPAGAAATGDGLVVFTTDGSVTCEPFTHVSTAVETYRGLAIHEPPSGDPSGASCAIDGRYALVGRLASVKAGLDAHANHQGVDSSADYRAARERLGSDRLATIFVARSALSSGPLASSLPSAPATADPAIAQALAALPAWVIAGVRAEDNALVADVVSAPFSPSGAIPGASLAAGASLLTAPPAHASRLAPLLPSDTALLYEVHGTGVVLQNLLAQVGSIPGAGSSLDQLEAALQSLGGPPSILGWIGDAGLVVLPDGTSATGGLVLLAPDDATATDKAAQLVGLVNLAKALGGATVTVTETTIDGTTVTLADFGEVPAGSGSFGGLGPAIPAGTHLVVSIAAHGPAVLIGNGESFPRRMLAAGKGPSLADQATYKTALALAASQNAGQLYIAAAPVMAIAETAIPAADKARYESDVKPYLAPLDALLETTNVDGNGLRARLVLTLK